MNAFDQYVLLLVVLDSPYCERVPISIGTLHIDMLIDLATKDELENLNRWSKWETISTRIAMKCMQIVESESQVVIVKMNSTVKLTHNLTIQPYDTAQTSGVSNVPNHSKFINVITEPLHSFD